MKPREKEIDHLVDDYFRYDPDTGIVYNKISRVGVFKKSKAGSISASGYLQIGIKNKVFLLHRVIWRLYYGHWPKYTIDHINGIKSDNRITNLRDIKQRSNTHNRIEHRNGNLFGCHFDKKSNKYMTRISQNNERFHIGYFETEKEAHEQYLRAFEAIKVHEFESAKELRDYLKTSHK